MSDIEEHLDGLPEEEEFEEMRKSATEFAIAVRESGALEAMVEAEDGLAEFSGTRGHEGAERAAEILKEFLQKAGQMGQEGAGNAMRGFRPQLGGAMGKTLQQMLNRGRGRKSMGQGGGDGYSAARNTSDNVGLYGSDQNYSESQSGGEGMSKQPKCAPARDAPSDRRARHGAGDGPLEAPGRLSRQRRF